jgi:hypothetical protein
MDCIKLTKPAFSFLAALTLVGCINLKKVNDYSSNSIKSLKYFEELGYSFTRACIEKCQIEQLEKKQLQRTDCDCRNENNADSVTLKIYNAVKGYYEGITKLSNNELTNYKFDALSKALTEGDFGEVKINKDHVNSYAKISSILTKAVTDGYRKKKLANYIGEANDAIKVLLNALEFNLVSNLSKRLDSKRQRVESYYFDLFRDTNVSAYEKKKIIEEFSNSLSDLEAKKIQISSFGKGLRTIAAGHQKLFENRNKMNTKEIKELLTQYSSDLQDIVDEFNKLKNQD